MIRALPFTIVFVIAFVSSAWGQDQLLNASYSLTATFAGQGKSRDFFHDVRVQVRSGRVTLRVMKDVIPPDFVLKDGETADTHEKPSGGLNGGYNREWRRRPIGQEAWLRTGRRIHGHIDADNVVRFGLTATRNGELISLHFIGSLSATGATGKVYYLPTDKPAVEGKWELHNPNPNSLPASPSVKGVTFGR